MTRVDPVPIDVSKLPSTVRDATSPNTPPEKRLLLAKAVLPLGPAEIVAALALLVDDRSDTVRAAARKTLAEMPLSLLLAGVSEIEEPGVLDRVVREIIRDKADEARAEKVTAKILENPATADETFAFVASVASGPLLEQVAVAQVRMMRYPRIIEALYFNPEARMGLVNTVLEFAVRNGIDLSHIPGYEEILESIFGPRKPAAPAPAPEPTQAPPVEAPVSTAFEQALEQALEGSAVLEEAMDDESFALLLEAASWEEEVEDEEEFERKRQALWNRISRLSVPQKVRLALVGNSFVRSILIKDSRRVVYMAVLKSPSTSEREVISFAKDRSLNDEIIRTIATNREWTKLYAVRHALVENPKCPPILALQFLKTLNQRDLRHIATSHDVPGYIARQAKQLLQARETGAKT